VQRQTLTSITGAAIIENGKIRKSQEEIMCQKRGLTQFRPRGLMTLYAAKNGASDIIAASCAGLSEC
jgi:hypothetical protein